MLRRAFRYTASSRLKRLFLPVAAVSAAAAAALVLLSVPIGSDAVGALLSKGKPSFASSSSPGSPPSRANDGSLRTRWMALSGAYPQRWTTDLGRSMPLGLVTVYWQRGDSRVYGYRIAGSNDRSDWTVLADRRANSTIGRTSDTVRGRFRYVRVAVLSSTYGWAQIFEVNVYTAGTYAPPATPVPAPTATASPRPTPAATLTFSPAPTPSSTPTLTFSPSPTPTPAAPSGGVVTVAGTSEGAIDSAVSAARSRGAGTTVYFPSGSYTHGTMSWPSGIDLRGDGIGRSRLNFALSFGSDSRIEDVTLGGTQSTAFSFANGAHDSVFEDVRFRGRGSSIWSATDFTSSWSDRVVNEDADFHDMMFNRAEFEYSNANADLWSIWWDSRAGGGRVYDITWQDCTFGVRNSAGAYGLGRVGFIMQPSPPEHAASGPRPGAAITGSTDYDFDWSRVTHGAGLAADPGADYGFRLVRCRFVGRAGFVAFNACDYLRAWAMTTFRVPTESPGDVTQTMRDRAPDRMTSKGWYVADCWFSDDMRFENGRDVTLIRNADNQGTAYNVPDVVRTHDAELYGS